MEYICKLCNQKIESNKHFWEFHSIKIADYFERHEPRETLTGHPVVFKKDIEQYFETQFLDLNDRNAWAKKNPEAAKELFIDLLVKRKLKKNWKYAPGETQLRLAGLPSILWFEKQFNLSFNEICKKLDFQIRFNNTKLDIDWAAPIEVIIDTREQKELNLDKHITIVKHKLHYGDYALANNEKISIERKSISDFAGTMSAGYERFQKELQRAKKDHGYLVILVESSWADFKSIEYLPQTKHIQSTFDHLAKRARDLYEQFDIFQIVFVDGRKSAAKTAEFILKLGKKVKKTDLQLLVNKKLI